MKVPPLLEAAVREDHLGHAYLFYGRDPREYEPAVRRFFRWLVCPRREGAGACGECPDCRQVDASTHPDLRVLDATREEDGSPRRSEIGVNTVRSRIVEPASLTPARSRYKLFWLNHVSQFTVEACNTLLKVLEEPPGEALFVLTTRSRREVLPTIRSRCQWIRFEPDFDRSETVLERCRRFWPDADLDEDRLRAWSELLRGRRRASSFEWNRQNTREFLSFLLVLVHRKYTGGATPDLPAYEAAQERLTHRHVPAILDRFDELDRYGNPVIAVNSLLEDLFFPGEEPQWENVI